MVVFESLCPVGVTKRHTLLHTSQQEEFQELKAKVKASGKRKDVTVPWSNIASYIVHHYLTLWLVNPLFSRKGCLEGLILPFVAGCGSPSQIYPWVNTKFRQKLSLWGVFAVWARRAIPGSGAVCCHEGGVWQAGNQPLDHPTTPILLRWVREWVARYPRIWQVVATHFRHARPTSSEHQSHIPNPGRIHQHSSRRVK